MFDLNEFCMLCGRTAKYQSVKEYEKVNDDGLRILGRGYIYSCEDHFVSLKDNELKAVPGSKLNV